MCCIIVKKKEHVFGPEYMKPIRDMGNRDGTGLAFVEGERDDKWKLIKPGRIRVFKTMGDLEVIENLWEQHMDNNIILHLRNATMGDRNEENCHPYWINNIDDGDKFDLVMFHNGSIRDVQINKDMSDSWNFAREFLRPYFKDNPNVLFKPAFGRLLSALIGANKLVFMDNRERIVIINHDMGAIHSTGVWQSIKSDIRSRPLLVAAQNSRRDMDDSSGEFCNIGHGVNTASNSLPEYPRVHDKMANTTSWIERREGAVWVMSADGRSHYHPKEKVQEDEDVGSTQGEAVKEVATTGNGSHDESGHYPSPNDERVKTYDRLAKKLDNESLDEVEKRIPQMTQNEIYNYVAELPVEAAALLKRLAKRRNAYPDYMARSIGQIAAFAMDTPWPVTTALVFLSRYEEDLSKIHEVS